MELIGLGRIPTSIRFVREEFVEALPEYGSLCRALRTFRARRICPATRRS